MLFLALALLANVFSRLLLAWALVANVRALAASKHNKIASGTLQGMASGLCNHVFQSFVGTLPTCESLAYNKLGDGLLCNCWPFASL